jgi:predicted DNA-binding transcriptional regulator AlpA
METSCNYLRPFDLEVRWRKSGATIFRMRKDGRLPPFDFHIGGRPVGWRLETIERLERGGK